MENFVKNEWGYHLYISSYTGNQRGVMVLINNTFEYELGRIKKYPNGNFIFVEMSISGKKITLVNIYGPNDDKPNFYTNLQESVLEFNNEHVIILWGLESGFRSKLRH